MKKQLISMNYSQGANIIPEYIVIHETDNWNPGANAQAHFNYWNTNPNANSSVHFVVDESETIQLAELNWRCWHVGDGNGSSGITNNNSIGIEICVNGDYAKARQNAIDLVKWLLPQAGLTADKVVRHKDATGKWCPRNMLDKPELWTDFVNQIGGITVLKKGSMGKEVADLQNKLNQLGYGLVVDGDFGPATDAAVKSFQGGNGLNVDGIVGAATVAKLDELLDRMNQPVEIDYKSKYEALLNGMTGIRDKLNLILQ